MRKNRFSFVTDAFKNKGDHSDVNASRKGGEPSLDLLEQMGYETRDVVLPTIRNWILSLFVFIIFMSALALGFYKLFVPNYEERERVAPLTALRRLPPNPQLQAHPKRDMILYHSAEDAVVNGYTWADKRKGTVSVPIDMAMDQLAQRGISGVTAGSAGAVTRSDAYPGSGEYNGGSPVPSRDAAPGETTKGASSGIGNQRGVANVDGTNATKPQGSAPESETLPLQNDHNDPTGAARAVPPVSKM